MPDQNGDKTQDPTPHRRQEARKKGQVAKSQDLASAVLLICGLMALMTLGGGIIDFLGSYSQKQLGSAAWLQADQAFAYFVWDETVRTLAKCLLPIFGIMFLVAIVVNLSQVGILFLPDKLAPDISRINPLKGFGRIFSTTGVMRLIFGLFKILVVATVALASLYHQRETLMALSALSVMQIAVFLIDVLLWTALKIGVALLILAVFDFAFQRWKHEQDMKMTQQEVREEMKNLEGDPQVRARRRQVQRQLALNQLSESVPKADVVVTNPTDLAIAIQYHPQTMAAPIVLAKGAGLIAQRIRRMALEHNIPIVEKKPLAQALYREVNINQPIPHDKYAAVAEILAYVYQLKGKKAPDMGRRASA